MQVPQSSLSTPRTPKARASADKRKTTNESEDRTGARHSVSPGGEYGTVHVDGLGANRSVERHSEPVQTSARSGGGRVKGSLWQEAETIQTSARARDEETEFNTDGVDEASLSSEALLQRCRKLKASDARSHAEVRRLQRELHAFVSFPFDVTEERRNDARASFEKVARAEADACKDVARLEGEVHQLRSVHLLQLKGDSEQPLEVHRLRAVITHTHTHKHTHAHTHTHTHTHTTRTPHTHKCTHPTHILTKKPNTTFTKNLTR